VTIDQLPDDSLDLIAQHQHTNRPTMAGLGFKSLATFSTAAELLLGNRPERAFARSPPLSVVRCLHIWIQFAACHDDACAFVLQVKE
jgi:hypothetical protein